MKYRCGLHTGDIAFEHKKTHTGDIVCEHKKIHVRVTWIMNTTNTNRRDTGCWHNKKLIVHPPSIILNISTGPMKTVCVVLSVTTFLEAECLDRLEDDSEFGQLNYSTTFRISTVSASSSTETTRHRNLHNMEQHGSLATDSISKQSNNKSLRW